jgi:hypothetical protein
MRPVVGAGVTAVADADGATDGASDALTEGDAETAADATVLTRCGIGPRYCQSNAQDVTVPATPDAHAMINAMRRIHRARDVSGATGVSTGTP